jgi:hypothetical protein
MKRTRIGWMSSVKTRKEQGNEKPSYSHWAGKVKSRVSDIFSEENKYQNWIEPINDCLFCVFRVDR